jgi:hypothetical protein
MPTAQHLLYSGLQMTQSSHSALKSINTVATMNKQF